MASVELDLAGVLAGEGGDLEIHYSAPSAAGARSWPQPARMPAGFGALAGSATLTASRTRIQAPFEPGTAPRIRIRPRSASVETISTFCVVTRVGAQVAGHLLALEHLARILALAGRTVRTVRDRDAVRGATAAEVVALHDALEALADRGARHVDLLAGDEMVGGDLGADVEQVVGGDAELGDLRLRLDRGGRRNGRAAPSTCSSPWRGRRRAERRCSRSSPAVRCATTWQFSMRRTVTGTCSPASL